MQNGKSIVREETVSQADLLLHSAIDFDQIIMLESELLAESFKEGSEQAKSLDRIGYYAKENSRKIRKLVV